MEERNKKQSLMGRVSKLLDPQGSLGGKKIRKFHSEINGPPKGPERQSSGRNNNGRVIGVKRDYSKEGTLKKKDFEVNQLGKATYDLEVDPF